MSMEGKVANPFEDENAIYHVLINDEGQHSLWPSFVEVPNGWRVIYKSASRAACLEFIDRNWADMRPKSLIDAMKGLPGNEHQAVIQSSRTTESKDDIPK